MPAKHFRFLVLIGFLLLTTYISYSQDLSLNYYSTGTGQNITTNYLFNLKNGDIGIGLGYNINRLAHPDDQNKSFYKRQYATEPLGHININVIYQRYILTNLEVIETFLFYDFQAKHSVTMNRANTATDVLDVSYRGPYYWLDNTVGVGFKVKIVGNLYLNQKAGFGAHFIIPSSRSSPLVPDNYYPRNMVWEFIGLLNVGLTYKLK